MASQITELRERIIELEQPTKPVIGKDVPGGVPSLRPGDVVKVSGHIGVIVKAETTVRGGGYQWDRPELPGEGNMPGYAIQFRTNTALRHAWWEQSEIDEVISLGPFH